MILLKNVPLEKQAQFLVDNICAYPDSPAFAKALGPQAGELKEGLLAYQNLLRELYTDLSGIQGADDDKRYTELLNNGVFMHACFAVGTECTENGQPCLHVDKPALQKRYKKGAIANKIRHLGTHSVTIRTLLADGTECASLSKAAQLSLSYDGSPALVPAVKAFADAIESLEQPAQNGVYNELGMYLKADYVSAFLQQPPQRDELDPLRTDIVNTAGDYQFQWKCLVERLLGPCALHCSGFWHYHASPSWSISFAEPRKRPLIIFTLGSSIVFIEFTLPISFAEAIIRARSGYSAAIRERIDGFRCVKCPKKCKGSNMKKVDGVSLCTGRAEARRIYLTLSFEDFDSIHAMLDRIYS